MAAAMAEWLRRLTRNQMGSSRVGSNPTRSDPAGFSFDLHFENIVFEHTNLPIPYILFV